MLNKELHFPSVIYTVQKPEFLESVKQACHEGLGKAKQNKKHDDLYPVYMTDSLFEDERIEDLGNFIVTAGWDILKDQGYNTNGLNTFLTELWCQEHGKHSLMEQHVHGMGAQIVGFYFIDTPENCSKPVFYDPRPGKVQTNLPENNVNNLTPASQMANFKPVPGMLIFANAWLPHSFTRHGSEEPIRFIHFSISAQYDTVQPAAEVI